MNISNYQKFVKDQTSSYMTKEYLVIALNEEAGEIGGWFKKYVLKGNVGKQYSKEDGLEEMGDVLFYLTALAKKFGWTLEDIMNYNLEKHEKEAEAEQAAKELTTRCKKHKGYKAVKMPKVSCDACWQMFKEAHGV
ncbi:MAG: hypothetical protein AB7J46_06555 [Candidatus Altimarinota bacterium]